jgi:hypothetical protein
MTKKQTYEFWNSLAISREHVLINVSNPTYIRDGTVSLKCKCECAFTTSAKSYYASKNGCPSCKKRKVSESTIERIKNCNSENSQIKTKTGFSKRRQRIKEAKKSFSIFNQKTNTTILI